MHMVYLHHTCIARSVDEPSRLNEARFVVHYLAVVSPNFGRTNWMTYLLEPEGSPRHKRFDILPFILPSRIAPNAKPCPTPPRGHKQVPSQYILEAGTIPSLREYRTELYRGIKSMVLPGLEQSVPHADAHGRCSEVLPAVLQAEGLAHSLYTR